MRAARLIPIALALTILVGIWPVFGQGMSQKRLILKDGTYQIVTRYEIRGNRVRYYSAEREEWEDLPKELVDWPATEKWNKEHVATESPGPPGGAAVTEQETPAQEQKEAHAIDQAEAAKRAQQQARTPVVAPGLRLPDDDGIWVLDNFQGIPELVELHQSAGDVNHGGTHNVLRAALASIHGAREPVRLNGQSARVRVHVDQPVLYVSLSTNGGEQYAPESAFMVNTHGDDEVKVKDSYSSPDSRYAIVRVQVQPGERVIGALRLRGLGNVTQSADIVPTTATILPGGRWMKVVPKGPLTIGEYALMEILAPGEINLDVWDFGVSPNSPENQHPITPVQAGSQQGSGP